MEAKIVHFTTGEVGAKVHVFGTFMKGMEPSFSMYLPLYTGINPLIEIPAKEAAKVIRSMKKLPTYQRVVM